MSNATVHRRKLATTGPSPRAPPQQCRGSLRRPSSSSATPRHRSALVAGAEQPTRAVRRRFPHRARCRGGQLSGPSGPLGLTGARRAPHAHTSLHAFRAYASNHPEFSELKARGLLP